jgi:hypothetical protein
MNEEHELRTNRVCLEARVPTVVEVQAGWVDDRLLDEECRASRHSRRPGRREPSTALGGLIVAVVRRAPVLVDGEAR